MLRIWRYLVSRILRRPGRELMVRRPEESNGARAAMGWRALHPPHPLPTLGAAPCWPVAVPMMREQQRLVQFSLAVMTGRTPVACERDAWELVCAWYGVPPDSVPERPDQPTRVEVGVA